MIAVVMKVQTVIFLLLAAAIFLFPACSINQLAMRAVANALTGEGSSDVFTGDSDPQLVGDALPFAIKLYESLLAANPTHQGLKLTTGSLFIMYANAFVQGPAEMLSTSEWQAREAGMNRAKGLYLRGMEILYDALEAKYKGFKQAAAQAGSNEDIFQRHLNRLKKEDVGLLYWAVAGGLSAYSIDVLDFELSNRIPEWTAMINRAYQLNPDFEGAALNEFFVIFYASLPEMLGGDKEKAIYHFHKAVEKTEGNSAGVYVSYAQLISIPANDYETFMNNLEKALFIDPDANPSTRLVNIISQQRARWLLDNAWQYFSHLPMPDDFW